MSSLSTTVAIADSSALFRLGVRNMAGHVKGFKLWGKPARLKTLWASCRVSIRRWSSWTFLQRDLTSTWSESEGHEARCRVLAITSEQSGHTIVNALKAGVDSYIKKDCDLGEVEDAIRETSQGGAFFCGQIWIGFGRSPST